jgi:DNA-binding PadR family transcriptional regulator
MARTPRPLTAAQLQILAASAAPQATYEISDYQARLLSTVDLLAPEPATTVAIVDRIFRDTHIAHNIPQTHTALQRLVSLTYLIPKETDPVPKAKGATPKAYILTPAGRAALRAKREAAEALATELRANGF